MNDLSKNAKITSWVCQVIAAVILGQTLFFKFTAAPESIYIFETIGAEPWGRIGSGLVELTAVILLLTPRFAVYGALLALPVIIGAIGAHLTTLGIVVQEDGGTLFILALVVLITASTVVGIRRKQLPLFKAGTTT